STTKWAGNVHLSEIVSSGLIKINSRCFLSRFSTVLISDFPLVGTRRRKYIQQHL
ncbi:hypothetical protein MKW98_024328, partial [Papaver atlanticum]